MIRTKIEYLADFIIVQMNHWALFPFMMLLICLSKSFVSCDDPNIPLWLFGGLLPFAFYVCRMRVHSLFPFMLSHLVFLVLYAAVTMTFCNSTASKVFYLLFALGYLVYSCHIRLNKSEFTDAEFLMPVAVGIAVVSSFMAHYLGFRDWDAYFLLPMIAVFGLYFIGCYLKNYLYFLKVNDSSTGHIPEKEIFRSGSFLALGFSILAMFFLFLVSGIEWLQVILGGVQEIILSVLRFLFSLIPESTPGEPLPEETPVYGSGLPYMGEVSEPSPFWNFILMALTTALVLYSLNAIFKLTKRFASYVIKQMKYLPMVKAREHETVKVMDVREKCTIEKNVSPGKKGGFFTVFTPQERIRRLYKKHIQSSHRFQSMKPGNQLDENPALLTAREWGAFLDEKEMPLIYEKARYSNMTCTADDLRQMKEACK